MDQLVAYRIILSGTVQGVGMRPALYRLAQSLALGGTIANNAAGVCLELTGPSRAMDRFLALLHARKTPPLPGITTIALVAAPPPPSQPELQIISSSGQAGRHSLYLPADRAICALCTSELEDQQNRRYRHPFISCTRCGPRYAITQVLPFDRATTTMSTLPLCPLCVAEYKDPATRRFHAQTSSCPACGPRLLWASGKYFAAEAPEKLIARAIALVAGGGILALKGQSGYHLCCNASDPAAVERLRTLKNRPHRPLAVIFANLATATKELSVAPAAAKLLCSPAAPIVLCPTRPQSQLAPNLAPGLTELGAFLAYTGLQKLLLTAPNASWVMTSANHSGEPTIYRDEQALRELPAIADGVLGYDQAIATRADDSVLQVSGNSARFLRRSRGYVPQPIPLPLAAPEPIIAFGGDQSNTLCLVMAEQAFMSHHLGDLESHAALIGQQECLAHWARLWESGTAQVACDPHPDYRSTELAIAEATTRRQQPHLVWHHQAHALALLAEWGESGPALVWTCDGTGLGPDNQSWGCELLLIDGSSFLRLATLKPQLLPGGDAAIRAPFRQGLAVLATLETRDSSIWKLAKQLQLLPEGQSPDDLAIILAQLRARFNTPESSGLGRFFDAAAALILGLPKVSYRAMGPARLEALAQEAKASYLLPSMDICEAPQALWLHGQSHKLTAIAAQVMPRVLDPRALWQSLVGALVANTVPRAQLAQGLHQAVATTLAETLLHFAASLKIKTLGLSGGCFTNRLLERAVQTQLNSAGLAALVHQQVPAGDGGLALGQAWCAVLKAVGR